ncbi:MAG: UDP-N-acetylmuramoyl-tripeptide--D-alanyl-D-alanine ligase [Patescibacteria group bacterium]|nr:UDP-N-acetylmuramoyl-tripeptide--D-alanyl-D-alanine ligase [Patescibacteria group bacterium]
MQKHLRKLKKSLKKAILWYLQQLVRIRLRRLKPEIIGVTGSVGKTSTKEAIYHVLSRRFQVLRNQKSYNTEFGILLAILEQESGFSSPLLWCGTLWKATMTALFDKTPYQKMVLEMGVDKPGDMNFLLKIVKPHIGILSAIKPIHLAEGQFKNLEEILKEKSKLVKGMNKGNWAILNLDDHYLSSIVADLDANVITYGLSEGADIRVSEVESNEKGLSFNLNFDQKDIPVHLPQLIGRHHIYVVLPAIAVGFLAGFKWETIKAGLEDFTLPPGRMNLLKGAEGSVIIDSSYNASPATMFAALEVLSELKPAGVGRRIAALGNMNELGDLTDSEHRRVGKEVGKIADMLITVGEFAKLYSEECGLDKSSIWSFMDSKEAGEFLRGRLKPGDVVLAKGSQNKVRMEKLVKEIMAEPERARDMLVRQEAGW